MQYTEDFNLMNGFITLYNREQVNPLLVIPAFIPVILESNDLIRCNGRKETADL